MRYDLDEGAGAGLRLGMIMLSTDETVEYEARMVLAGRDVNLMHARIPAKADVTPEDLASMAPEMTRTAALLPRGLRAVAYACTSGATIIGSDEVARLIHLAHPGVPVSNPLSAVIAALHRLQVRRIAMVTPYVREVSGPMAAALGLAGIEVLHAVSFGQKEDWTVARITEASTRCAMLEAGRMPGVEAVFASCTNLRSFGVIEAVEAELGLPVVTSNQALFWDMLGRAGADARGWGPGRLFTMEHGKIDA
ncbi:MAG: Asp/Glu racemase [Roseovarius sp.]|uniref:maleate cis-trans isomerase family protein n=1 Tax=Roseovarius sp. TaxID=1486281 RepID=UPI001B40B37E|nr:Asp/Glu racemase [Roseovarius sp.]MBQ0749610.1 Asp/Glu racemase [Roseovarius sp.]MBQ0808947.1 Asp/Glu racemase [Roseovarius sp.]